MILRSPDAAILATEPARGARQALAALNTDQPDVVELLQVLDAADERGLEPVLEQLLAWERQRTRVLAWVNTPTWVASRQYLHQHPDLLTNPLTHDILGEGADGSTLRQHLAIARLAATMPIDSIYDAVVDARDAADAAMSALDQGDLDQLTELRYAAPHLAQVPFTGPLVAAVLTTPVDPDQARELIRVASTQADIDTRTAAAARLRALAGQHPALAGTLRNLADLLVTDDRPDSAEPTSEPAPQI